MKSAFIIGAFLSGASAYAIQQYPFDSWKAPGHDDVRGPCPGLNTLANYGLLPRDGRSIDLQSIINTFASFNGEASFATSLFQGAVKTNIYTPNATTFSLHDLRIHDHVEHDASLSREDAYFGDDHTFDPRTYNQSKSYWTSETVTIQMAANARAARVATSSATNPTFNQTYNSHVGFGEPAAYFMVLGEHVTQGNQSIYTVNRSFVQYLFEHERFPVHLGWTPPTSPLTIDEFVEVMKLIAVASPGNAQDPSFMKRTGLSLHGF